MFTAPFNMAMMIRSSIKTKKEDTRKEDHSCRGLEG